MTNKRSATPLRLRGRCRMCRARTDELSDGAQTVPLQVLCDAGIDLLADERIVEERRADPNCRSASDQELQRVICGANAALADDGHVVLARDFVDLMHLQQSDRLDRRTGQPSLDVAD